MSTSGDSAESKARLLAEIAERRDDAEFMARVRAQVASDKPLLDRLADTPEDAARPLSRCLDCDAAVMSWQTLTEAVEQAERDDPAVAKAAARLDAAIDDLNYQAALRRFRPLPWDGR
jgi:hypothetical protein